VSASHEHPDLTRWRLYAIEAVLLGTFMVSACAFAALVEHPSSPVRHMIASPLGRRALVGLAMGCTAVALIYSPWGKRSGALMNPATTLSVLRMGKLAPRDAIGYIVAQFLGAAGGVGLMTAVGRMWVGHPNVRYVATVPGGGIAAAWFAEFLIAFLLVTIVFNANRVPRLAKATGVLAGLLVATYITLESPISGMSMNPARTFGSAVWAHLWTGWWVYLTAPTLGMLAATELHRRFAIHPDRLCARLTHSSKVPCILRCNCLAHAASETQQGTS
jgi:aquaporin Z